MRKNADQKDGMKFYPFTSDRLVWSENRKGVIQGDGYPTGKYYCGYVAFDASQVPDELRRGMRNPMEYLAIHGGITYCRQEPGGPILRAIYYGIMRAVCKTRGPFYWIGKLVTPKKAKNQYWYVNAMQKLIQGTEYHLGRAVADYVVFGYDCQHLHDERNPMLRDLEHIKKLTEQMESQIVHFLMLYPEFKKSTKEKKIETLEWIRAQATLETGWGLGAMLGMLSGAKELGEPANGKD